MCVFGAEPFPSAECCGETSGHTRLLLEILLGAGHARVSFFMTLVVEQGLTSIKEVVFFTNSLCYLDSTGNFPSDVSSGNASEEVQVVRVGGFQATSDQAAGVVQCWIKVLGVGQSLPNRTCILHRRIAQGQSPNPDPGSALSVGQFL